MMKLIEEYSDIKFYINSIRSLRKGFITNFYPEDFKTNLWISQKELFLEIATETIFFFHKKNEFTTFYYCSTTSEALNNSLNFLRQNDILITDIITNNISSPVLDVYYDHGFTKYSSLVRMSKIGKLNDSLYIPNEKIKNATLQHIPEIQLLFDNNFDKYTEQIPVYEELEQWVKQSHLIVYELDSIIAGFLIYDLTGISLYLRYWFVRSEYRDLKIGSELIKEFSYRGKETKRQIFWVLESNDNAIKRYEHYGFTKETMFDYVLIKNK